MTPPPAAAAAPSVRPRRAPAPRAPRRVSGPARPPARPATAPRRAGAATAQPGLVIGMLAALEALAQHRLLDRLIRGRVWIGIVAFALIGIVTMQLGLLKLNGAVGRALEHEATLQRENSALSIQNSELAAGPRVESSAAKLGMSFVSVGALRFLTAKPDADARKAAVALASAVHAAAQAREASASESPGEASTSGESGTGEASSSTGPSGESSTSTESASSTETTSSAESSSSAAGSASEVASAGGEVKATSEPSASETPTG